MTTKTRTVLTSVVDHPGSINGESNCIDSPCNERRVVVHTPTVPSSHAININSGEHLGVCNTSMRVASPKGKISTVFLKSFCKMLMAILRYQLILLIHCIINCICYRARFCIFDTFIQVNFVDNPL